MANLILKNQPAVPEILATMREDACFDVADDKESDTRCIPDSSVFTTIHTRQAPPKVPKVFLSNDCRFNCAYCGCRSTRDKERYSCEPRQLAEWAFQDAQQNGRGVFITSAICKSADYTEERIVEVLRCMREDLHYTGYLHAKVMPGADPLLIRQAGHYADRLSVNIEVAQSEGYAMVAKQKNRDNILTPMRQISNMIQEAKKEGRSFATSQTTQLMAGSTGESDHTILTLSKALYGKYRLGRVYYTAFQYQNPAQGYDLPLTATPQWRMRRLYQADRLMQLYGFAPEEIAPAEQPDLPEDLDPKVSWALRNIERFPMEVNTAEYEDLLRVPGIGVIYAKKILRARRYGRLTHETLIKMGISLKKAGYFIQCEGKYRGGRAVERPDLLYPVFREVTPVPFEQLTFF